MSAVLLDRLLHLPAKERLELAEALWHSLADETPDQAPISDWHRELLEERLAEIDRDGLKGEPWQKVLGDVQ
jgi:putative addiction module component (TIGR02574 family)